MISIKSGTQTWSDSDNTQLKGDSKTKTMSTDDLQKHFGGKDLGEILNKAADPNWIDPKKKMRQVGSNKLDKDAFLKLFLANLKNQDPTSPMESHDMAAQMAQFTSLEKLQNIDSGINRMADHQTNSQTKDYDTLNLIGKSVAGDSSKIVRSDEAEMHEISFRLPQKAMSASVEVLDQNNNVIRTLSLSKLDNGENSFEWNGDRDDGSKAVQGNYKVNITAIGGNGRKLAAQTKFEGRISGVNFTSEGPVLMMGRRQVKLSDVKKIFEAQNVDAAKPVINKAVVTDGIPKEGAPVPAVGGDEGNLANVGLSREMITKIQKTTGQGHGLN